MDTICGSSGNVNYKRQLKERFPEPGYQVDIKVVQQDAIFLATVTIIFEVGGEDREMQKRGSQQKECRIGCMQDGPEVHGGRLKGLFTNFFLSFKSHILDSNGVWYS